MKLIDSSGWLQFFTDGPLSEAYREHLGKLGEIVTPTVVLYEVYKRLKRERSEEDAAVVAAQLLRTRVVELSPEIALTAADLSLEHRLAMADAIIYATARALDARSSRAMRTSRSCLVSST